MSGTDRQRKLVVFLSQGIERDTPEATEFEEYTLALDDALLKFGIGLEWDRKFGFRDSSWVVAAEKRIRESDLVLCLLDERCVRRDPVREEFALAAKHGKRVRYALWGEHRRRLEDGGPKSWLEHGGWLGRQQNWKDDEKTAWEAITRDLEDRTLVCPLPGGTVTRNAGAGGSRSVSFTDEELMLFAHRVLEMLERNRSFPYIPIKQSTGEGVDKLPTTAQDHTVDAVSPCGRVYAATAGNEARVHILHSPLGGKFRTLGRFSADEYGTPIAVRFNGSNSVMLATKDGTNASIWRLRADGNGGVGMDHVTRIRHVVRATWVFDALWFTSGNELRRWNGTSRADTAESRPIMSGEADWEDIDCGYGGAEALVVARAENDTYVWSVPFANRDDDHYSDPPRPRYDAIVVERNWDQNIVPRRVHVFDRAATGVRVVDIGVGP